MADTPVQAPSPQLDDSLPITPLQSATILNILKAMAPQAIFLIGKITGKAFDLATVNQYIDAGGSLLASCITLYYALRAIRSRINATQTIIKKG